MKIQEKAQIIIVNGKKAMFLPESFVENNDDIDLEYEDNIITLRHVDKFAAFFNNYEFADDKAPINDDAPAE